MLRISTILHIMNINGKIFASLIRLLLFLIILILLGAMVIRKFIFIGSDQAFVNTKLITIRAPLTGIIQFSEIDIGTLVQENQNISEIVNPRFGNMEVNSQSINMKNHINTIEIEIARNLINIEKESIQYQRYDQLRKVGAVSQQEFEEIDSILKILKVTTENKEKYLVYLKKRLKEIERQIELQKRSVVKAPSEGVIWSILTKNGEHVDLGDELFQIVNPDEIWVDAFFSERYAAKLKPGQRMMVQLLGTDEQWDGEVVFVRGGSGRVTYNAAVEMPPILMSRRLVSVRLKVNWRDYFKDSEFFGVGRSMTVKLNREGPVNSFINKFLDY